MHVLFVHQNFPAQFGHIARKLVREHGWQCTCLSRNPPGNSDGVSLIQYELKSGATEKTHYCTRSFENAVSPCQGVYEACRQHRELRPDLIVGHSGFGSTLFLRELYDCPIINYFEYYYRPHGSDMDFRPEFPPQELDILRSYCRNAMILLDLENCHAGYCPTQWQKSLLPARYADKVRVIHDGVDTDLWRRQTGLPREIGPHRIDADTRIVTYVARGLESMRGFDIFMKLAKRIYQQMPNVAVRGRGGRPGILRRRPEPRERKELPRIRAQAGRLQPLEIPLHRHAAARTVGTAALAQRPARLFDRALCLVMVACWMPWPAVAPWWRPTPNRCGK